MRLFPFLTLCLGYTLCATADENAQLKVLSTSPYIAQVENFLSDEECHFLIEMSKDHLVRSQVINADEAGSYTDSRRTSEGFFLYKDPTNPQLTHIERKIENLTGFPIRNSEDLHILHYAVGGEYKPHFDYFDAKTPGGAYCMERGGQRIATVILYLNTPEKGGETIFPKLSIVIKPIKGQALIFHNCTPEGLEDPSTLHGGAPVVKGDKWIATRWIRQRDFS